MSEIHEMIQLKLRTSLMHVTKDTKGRLLWSYYSNSFTSRSPWHSPNASIDDVITFSICITQNLNISEAGEDAHVERPFK